MTRSVATFLMFEGDAEDAMRLYEKVVPGAEITALLHRDDGRVQRGEMTMCGHVVRFYDSPVHHEFTFTPSVSLFVECESSDELDRLFDALSADGRVYMPLQAYDFSTRFGWCSDRFGVSWQLNLG